MGYFVVKQSDVNRQYYFRFNGNNHEQILASEMYHNKLDCINGIESVKRIAPYDGSYIRSDNVGNYRFNMVVPTNHKIVARSSEGYETRYGREHAIATVKSEVINAPVYEW